MGNNTNTDKNERIKEYTIKVLPTVKTIFNGFYSKTKIVEIVLKREISCGVDLRCELALMRCGVWGHVWT